MSPEEVNNSLERMAGRLSAMAPLPPSFLDRVNEAAKRHRAREDYAKTWRGWLFLWLAGPLA